MERTVQERWWIALVVALTLLGGCGLLGATMRGAIPAPGEAQRTLVRFARALEAWDRGRLDRLLLGGLRNPLWRRREHAFNNRGIRYREVVPRMARAVHTRVAMGSIAFKLVGASVDSDPLLAQVILLQSRKGGWKVTYWGRRVGAQAHLRWLLAGNEPLLDPGLRR